MPYKMMFVWVEGPDDVRFFDRIVKPRLDKKYDLVKTVAYSRMKNDKIINFLKSIKSMKADYFFTADINNSPCISQKKTTIKRKITNVDRNRIMVIKKEIESWYLAGLTAKLARELKLPVLTDTEGIAKEKFNQLIPNKFQSRIDFMVELLNSYNFRTARLKNRSFKYFTDEQN